MHEELAWLGLLVTVVALLLVAYRTRIPYPIVLVAGSAVLAFAPGAPRVDVDPDVILVLVLPPLLYSAAFFTSLRDVRENLRPIGQLAFGLVIGTTVVVGVAAHVVAGLPWEVAFVLGAIVSPTDPVAATSIAGRLGAPRRYVTIVEGESLINDATGLVVYKFAVAAVVAGTFSLAEAAGAFVLVAAGGIALGLAVAWLVALVRRRVEDPLTEITISFVTPYLAYLPAERLGASAVLAAVSAGIYLGLRAPQLISPETRIQAYSFWEVIVFLLNSALFVLVGLELPAIADGLRGAPVGEVLIDALAVLAAVLLVRFAWVFLVIRAAPRVTARVRGRPRGDGLPRAERLLVAWTGMRGAVSLAAALAVPSVLDSGAPFPEREQVIVLAYAVILGTLVLQGLTLPALIERLGLGGDTDERREAKARLRAAEAAIARIEELAEEDWVREETAERMLGLYRFRVRRFGARLDDDDDGALEEGSLNYQRLRHEALEAERAEVLRLRDAGRIGEEAMRRIERDLDLEAARLEL